MWGLIANAEGAAQIAAALECVRATRDAHAPRCARANAPSCASASSYGSAATATVVGTLVREARPGASVQLYRVTHYEVEGDDELIDLVPFTVALGAEGGGAVRE